MLQIYIGGNIINIHQVWYLTRELPTSTSRKRHWYYYVFSCFTYIYFDLYLLLTNQSGKDPTLFWGPFWCCCRIYVIKILLEARYSWCKFDIHLCLWRRRLCLISLLPTTCGGNDLSLSVGENRYWSSICRDPLRCRFDIHHLVAMSTSYWQLRWMPRWSVIFNWAFF